MRRLNKKGFTMVELLATITILGLLMSIAIGSISKILSKSKDDYYKDQEENLIMIAQNYTQNNRSKLPKNIGQKVNIYLKELYDNKVLKDKVKDNGKKDCDMNASYVQVFKVSQENYEYVVYLKCPNYTSKITSSSNAPVVNASFSGSGSSLKANVTINGNDKIVGYSYVVSHNDGSGLREVKNSGSLDGKQKSSISFNIDLSKWSTGSLKVVVSATNSFGNTKTTTINR